MICYKELRDPNACGNCPHYHGGLGECLATEEQIKELNYKWREEE